MRGSGALIGLLLLTAALAAAAPVHTKETLIKFGDVVWVKVSVEVPEELVATREYEIPITVRVVEVDGELEKFLIKGIKIRLGSSVMEYVPDTPVMLTAGGFREFRVKLEPRFFAAQMAPGDVKYEDMRIDFAYYLEAARGEGEKAQEVIESGLYTVFASIPVRIVAPRTYVYVQPRLNVTYEPYIVNFTARIWVEGEGFIENARMEVKGAPVQCYLLTTGRMEAGESRVLWTVMNVSELGPFAQERYGVTVTVTAVTPWGYTYTYSYPLKLELRKLRRVEAQVPNVVAAGALFPVRISLTPPPQKGESVSVTVTWRGRQIYSGSYRSLIYTVIDAEGEGVLTVRVSSDKYAPATVRARVKAVKVEPKLTAGLSGDAVYFRVTPLIAGSTIEVKAVNEEGAVAFSRVIPAESLSKSPVSVGGASATAGTGSAVLDLEPGRYTVIVAYRTPYGAKSTSFGYEVASRSPLGPLSVLADLVPLPFPLNLAVIAAPAAGGVAGAALLAVRRRGKRR